MGSSLGPALAGGGLLVALGTPLVYLFVSTGLGLTLTPTLEVVQIGAVLLGIVLSGYGLVLRVTC